MVMKSQLQLLVVITSFFFLSCSVENTAPNNDLGNSNGFQFDNIAYVTDSVYITPENEIILSSKEISNGMTTNNIDFAHFITTSSSLSEKSYYTGDGLASCTALTEGDWTGGTVENGEIILSDTLVDNGFIRVVYLNRTKKEVHLIFEFERADGELVAGSFEGNYTTVTF